MKQCGKWGKIDVPAFHPCITASQANGRCKNELRLKASQVGALVRISRDLFEPLLAPTQRNNYTDLRADIGWRAWLAHIKVYNALTARTFTRAQA